MRRLLYLANVGNLMVLSAIIYTYLLFLLIEVIDDDTNKEIEGEERAKDNEEDKVDVHVDVDFSDRLIANLKLISFQADIQTMSTEMRRF